MADNSGATVRRGMQPLGAEGYKNKIKGRKGLQKIFYGIQCYRENVERKE